MLSHIGKTPPVRLGGMTPAEQAATPVADYLRQIQQDASEGMGLVDCTDYRILEQRLKEARNLFHQIHMVAGYLQGLPVAPNRCATHPDTRLHNGICFDCERIQL